ncbi:hypothetical protein [Sutterella wadsworthensis]|uniref:hypothetical protein n=1 Tax=Sutterella wadsworthensis TaxID=40545 RepID=UPI003C6FDAF7
MSFSHFVSPEGRRLKTQRRTLALVPALLYGDWDESMPELKPHPRESGMAADFIECIAMAADHWLELSCVPSDTAQNAP